jgi:Big-like domain-containing protein
MNSNLNRIQRSAASRRRLWFGVALAVVALLILAGWKLGRFPFFSPRLNSIQLTPQSTVIPRGLTRQFFAIGTYSDGSVRDLTDIASWSSTDSSALAIDNTGMATAVHEGSSIVQVTSGSIRNVLKASITPPSVVGLAVSPANRSVGLGTVVQYSVIGTSSDGTTQTFTDKVQWSSTNPDVVTVTSSGLAKAVGAGDSVIRVTYEENVATNTALAVTRNSTGFSGVFASRNDGTRTAQYRNEKTLTLKNVNAATFGKKFSDPVDGYVYAQPLYVPGVDVPAKGVHNVVYVATENNSVYAFDADSAGPPLWNLSLGPPAPQWALPCKDIQPTVGVTGTPVIDPKTNTLYVVARTVRERTNFYHLHALDLATGAEKFGGPVQISASVSGTAEGSRGGKINFDAQLQLQRPGLVLTNGNVYITFGSMCDFSTFHGWIFAYDAQSLKQTSVFLTTPNGGHGGIWQSGAAPTLDLDGNLYVVVGDGFFDANLGGSNYGQSVVKFSLNRTGISPIDYFAPFDQEALDKRNMDLGTGGSILLPDQSGVHPHLLITVGKAGTIYVLDRDNLGHFKASSNDQIVQSIPQPFPLQEFPGKFHSSPAFWQGKGGSWVYIGGVSDKLRAFSLTNGVLSTTPTSMSANTFSYPGASPAISSDENSNGIVWAISNGIPADPVLNAYDATNLGNLLYSSDQAPNHRDKPDPPVKFVVPVVANGKVYFGTQNSLEVYGLLP